MEVIQEHEANSTEGKVMNMPIQVWDTKGRQRRMVCIYVCDGILCIDIDPEEIVAAP